AELRGAEVRNVLHGAPGDRGGLAIGDRLVAIDGAALGDDDYPRILASLSVDVAHQFTVERLGRVVELSITPIVGGDPKFEIVELEQVSAEQLLLRREWLGLK